MFGIPKNDKTLTLNHQLGKIVLHSVSSRESTLRVRKTADGTLEAMGRPYNGVWHKDNPTADPKFLAALNAFLTRQDSTGYWYINKDVVAQVSKRFQRLKKA